MAGQDSIAFWTVDRLKPPNLEAGRGGAQALRTGNVVEARVSAMLGRNVAQLEILGQTIEVATPRPLQVGVAINVAIQRGSHGLELIIQPDGNGSALPASPPGGGATSDPASAPRSTGLAAENPMTAAQAAINEAALDGAEPMKNANAASAAPAATVAALIQETAVPLPPQAQLQAQIRARYGIEPAPGEPEFDQGLRLGSLNAPAQAAPGVAHETLAAPASSGAPAPTMVVPYQSPFVPHAILMHVEQRDDDDGESEGQEGRRQAAAKRWTVRFALDAGTIGPVQVSIGLCADALSVKLSSGLSQSASFLSARLPELKASLEEADFSIEDLSVQAGGQ